MKKILPTLSNKQPINFKRSKARNIITPQINLGTKVEQSNEWMQYIAKSSYNIMWDWNINSGYIYMSDNIKEVFGYTLKNNTSNFKNFIKCIVTEERDTVLKKISKAITSKSNTWKDSFHFFRLDGSIATTTSSANIIRDEKGNAIHLIGTIKDISKVHELENKFKEQIAKKKVHRDVINTAIKLSYDGIWNWNILTNKFVLSDGFEKLFGVSLNNIKNGELNWATFIHPDDRKMVEQGMKVALESPSGYWEQAYRLVKDDGSIANVLGRASIIRDANNRACRMVGVIHDISDQKILEEKLAMEMKLKAFQIAEATEYAKESERSDIGKELHDNINQLLGASKLYLDMAKRGGKESEMYLNRSSEYTTAAIEEIRKLTKGLTTDYIKNMGLCPAIENLVDDMLEVNPVKISCALKDFVESSVNNKFKLNIFRIVQEQMNNILKHARATQINITLLQNKQSVVLGIADNGIGFNTEKESNGIGVANIKSRVALYNGSVKLISQPGEGCILNVVFPTTPLILK